MASIKLTDGEVEGTEPGEKDVYLWDSALPRFGVRITPAAARIYLVQYRAKAAPGLPSKTRRIVIGQHDGDLWNATKARAAARKLLAPVDLGKDPFADREEARAARAAAERAATEEAERQAREAETMARDTFEKVAERFILTLPKTRYGTETARLLRHDAIPVWGSRHVSEISRRDVAELIDTVRPRAPGLARLLHATLRVFFRWCRERDLLTVSPCDGLRAPARVEARDRVLSDVELKAIWLACDAMGGTFAPIIKLLMLTGQRRAEVGGMAWSELDIDAAVWRLPKERSKNAKAHEVDLGHEAMAIIKAVQKTGDLLFPARNASARTGESKGTKRAGPRPVEGFGTAKRRLDELLAGKVEADWRLHDLRRSAASGMASLGFGPHIIEKVLNHASGVNSGLVAVYQRFDHRSDRKAALTAWDKRVAGIVSGTASPSNVITPSAWGRAG